MIPKILYKPKTKKKIISIIGYKKYIKINSIISGNLSFSIQKLLFRTKLVNFSKYLPTYVAIEINSYCNRKCTYCPNSKYNLRGNKNKYMNERLFYKIINDLRKMNYTRNIYYHIYNEPMTDRRLPMFVEYTRKKLKNVTIDIYTNGDYLNFDMYYLLIEKGVDRFIVSIHSENPSKNLIDLLNKMPDDEVEKNFVIRNRYKEYKNNRSAFYNRGGSIETNRDQIRSRYCKFVLACNIDSDGNVNLCCNDYFGSKVLGNLNSQSLKSIWFNEEYVKLRNQIYFGNRFVEICKKCDL